MHNIFYNVMNNNLASLATNLSTITDPSRFDKLFDACRNLCNNAHCVPTIKVTVLALAEGKKHSECVSLLINRIVELGGKTESVKKAIGILIKKQTDLLRKLLDNTKEPITPDFLSTMMLEAAKHGQTEHLILLLAHFLASKITPKFLGDLVNAAASNGSPECLHILLTHSLASEITPEQLGHAVIGAASNGNPTCLHILLMYLSENKINITPELLGNALIAAATYGNPACLRILLAHPFANKITPEQLGNAVIAATENGKTDSLRILIEYASKLNITLDLDNALLIAIELKKTGCLCLLIEEGADPNSAANGNTAIALAAKSGNVTSMARLLLEEKVTLSDDDIELLQPYKKELFKTFVYYFHLNQTKQKTINTLLSALNPTTYIGKLFHIKRGTGLFAQECSLERGTLKDILEFLKDKKVLPGNRTAPPQPMPVGSKPENSSTTLALRDVLSVPHSGKDGTPERGPSEKILAGHKVSTTSTATTAPQPSHAASEQENISTTPAPIAVHEVMGRTLFGADSSTEQSASQKTPAGQTDAPTSTFTASDTPKEGENPPTATAF